MQAIPIKIKELEIGKIVGGNVRPQAVELEEAVLGAVMLDKDAFPSVVDILQPSDFYLPKHQEIYQAYCELFSKNNPIDLLTTTEEVRKKQKLDLIGGPVYLVELTNRVASAANIEYHARIILQKSYARNLIDLGFSLVKNCYEDTRDVFELSEEAQKGIFSILGNNANRALVNFSDIQTRYLQQVSDAMHQPDGLIGVPTGFKDLDKLFGGWRASDLQIIAARPGMGKTAFVLANAIAAAKAGDPVAFFSLEMDYMQLFNRAVAMEAGIDANKIMRGQLTSDEFIRVEQATEELAKLPIFIDDTPGQSVFAIRAKSRRLKMQHDIQLVIVDYLQLMSGEPGNGRGNREQEISTISRGLKTLAKEMLVPVIALSQLSRNVETRGGSKRPMLSDLRESGSIEQDADGVSFIFRAEYYDANAEDEEGNSLKGVAEIITAKNRHGALKTTLLRFIDYQTKFTDYDYNELDELDEPKPGNNLLNNIRKDDGDIPF